MDDDKQQNVKGLRDRLEPEAARMYIEDAKSVAEIAAALEVSEVTVRKWREWADWDGQRKKFRERLAGIPETLRAIGEKTLNFIDRLPPSEINSGHLDMCLKASKLIKQQRDPGEVLNTQIDALTGFGIALGRRDVKLAAAVADYIDEYIIDLKKASEKSDE